jgi:hypothetical protein
MITTRSLFPEALTASWIDLNLQLWSSRRLYFFSFFASRLETRMRGSEGLSS